MHHLSSTKKTVSLLAAAAVVTVLAAPAPAMDMQQREMASGRDASRMPAMQMQGGSMQMEGSDVMLPGSTVAGITAMGHLKDIRAAMQKMNMPQTHHFMVMLTDARSGEPVAKGAAAVKITDPSGRTGEPVKLMAMPGGFGADVTLDTPGDYTFTVGTRLADGKKRRFTFHYTMR